MKGSHSSLLVLSINTNPQTNMKVFLLYFAGSPPLTNPASWLLKTSFDSESCYWTIAIHWLPLFQADPVIEREVVGVDNAVSLPFTRLLTRERIVKAKKLQIRITELDQITLTSMLLTSEILPFSRSPAPISSLLPSALSRPFRFWSKTSCLLSKLWLETEMLPYEIEGKSLVPLRWSN